MNASPIDLHDSIMPALPHKDAEAVASLIWDGRRQDAIARIVEASPVDGLSEGDVAGYVDAMLEVASTPVRGEQFATAEKVFEDLKQQPIIQEAADYLRAGCPRAATLSIMVEEGYARAPAEGAVALLAREVGGADVALVEIAPAEIADSGAGKGEWYIVRYGDLIFRSRPYKRGGMLLVDTGNDRIPASKVHQAWRIVPKAAVAE